MSVRAARARVSAAVALSTVVLASCTAANEPSEPSADTEELAAFAAPVCAAVDEAFTTATDEMAEVDPDLPPEEVAELDEQIGTELVATIQDALDELDDPTGHDGLVDQLHRGIELNMAAWGYDLDGVEPADSSELDDDGFPTDLWLHLGDDTLAAAFNDDPACADLAERQQGGQPLFAADGLDTADGDATGELDGEHGTDDGDVPYGEGLTGEDAVVLFTQDLFARALGDNAPPLRDPALIASVATQVPEMTVTVDEDTVGDDGFVQIADRSATWCLWLPESTGDGHPEFASGSCDDENVTDALQLSADSQPPPGIDIEIG